MTKDITILYEDKDILAINKPAGLVVHSDGRTQEKTLTDWIISRYPDLLSVGEPQKLQNGAVVTRPGVVHRLDRETSGVVVLAKNQTSFESLKKQFQEHTVKKVYSAFVYGCIKQKQGIIDIPIGRSKSDFRLWLADARARGHQREAITEYQVLEEGVNASFIEVLPKTGRTHQIRVHMKAINHPVVCDKRYAPKRSCILGLNRLALHARLISVRTYSGSLVVIEAPLPEDFSRALKRLREEDLAE